MPRVFENVVDKIRDTLLFCCDNETMINKWQTELETLDKWLDILHMERMTKYWNIAPEKIEEMKWIQLGNVLNNCIPNGSPVYEWEVEIVNLFLDKEEEKKEETYDTIIFPYIDDFGVEWYDRNTTMEDYMYLDEEEKEQLKLDRMEHAASKNVHHKNIW